MKVEGVTLIRRCARRSSEGLLLPSTLNGSASSHKAPSAHHRAARSALSCCRFATHGTSGFAEEGSWDQGSEARRPTRVDSASCCRTDSPGGGLGRAGATRGVATGQHAASPLEPVVRGTRDKSDGIPFRPNSTEPLCARTGGIVPDSPLSIRSSGLASSADLDATVRRTVLQLNSICKTTTLRFTLAVGGLVLRSLYDGDIARLRSRERKDHAALRRVAADPDLAMSPSVLYRSIAIFEVCERIGFRSWKHLSTSHVRVVLPLAPETQERLLQDAEANRWPVRELEEHVAALAERPPHRRGGRKRRTRLRTMLTHLQREAVDVRDLLAADDEPTTESSPESVRAAVDALERMRDACCEMLGRLACAQKPSGIHWSGTRTAPAAPHSKK
jgi:hypothetical protein